MKISRKKEISQSSSINKASSGGKAEKPEKSAAKPSSEVSVDISSRAKELETVKVKVSELPDVRTEEVEKVSTSLKRGTYQVEAKKVAKKMIHESLSESLHDKNSKKKK